MHLCMQIDNPIRKEEIWNREIINTQTLSEPPIIATGILAHQSGGTTPYSILSDLKWNANFPNEWESAEGLIRLRCWISWKQERKH